MDLFTFTSSWLVPTILVLPISFIFIYALTSKTLSIGAPNLPPNPPTLPLIGNLHQLLGKPRHRALWELSQKYGPLMLLRIGAKPYLVISSASVAKQVLKTHDHKFCTRPLFEGCKRLSYNYLDVAFSPYDEHWKVMRKILVSELLGPKRARSFNLMLVSEIQGMVHSLMLHPSNTPVNLDKMFLALVKAVVCKVAFGKNYREEPLTGPSWEEMLDDAMMVLDGSLGDNFPWIGKLLDKLTGWNGKLEKCFSNLDAYIQIIVDEHLNDNIAQMSEDDKDFVHALVELSLKTNTSEYRVTKDEMKALIMDVLTGGTDTTIVTMVWAMSEIAKNPRVKQKLQSEIRKCIGRKQNIKQVDITKMTYLKMVVKETLRLHSPAPFLIPHECLSHCQIGGYDVFPGATVLINGWGIGRDPNTWGENSTEFYPERFENLDVDYGWGDFEMVPFGGGRRTCPAMNTAPATIEFMIANLLYWFDWEVPGGVENLNMEEKGSLVVHKKSSLYLVPVKHNWED